MDGGGSATQEAKAEGRGEGELSIFPPHPNPPPLKGVPRSPMGRGDFCVHSQAGFLPCCSSYIPGLCRVVKPTYPR